MKRAAAEMRCALEIATDDSYPHSSSVVNAEDALRAALDSLESSGWVCVPREMTAEMRDLVGKVEGATRAIQDRRCWMTALAAAPRLTGEKR
jgi:hypothetical protein